MLKSIVVPLHPGAETKGEYRGEKGLPGRYNLAELIMIGLGIVLTILTLVIIIFRIKAEVGRRRLSSKGGYIVGSAFALSLAAIVSVALLTTEDSLGMRLSVLGLCIAFVFSSYKFAKRFLPNK